MATTDVHGPIDFLLIEFPLDQKATGKTAAALMDLIDRRIVWVYDLLIIAKDEDGTVAGIEWSEDAAVGLDGFDSLASVQSGLLDEEDIAQAAAAMNPGTVAALLIYENLWAIPFVAAAREAGGEVIASARIPAQDIMDVLDAVEAASTN